MVDARKLDQSFGFALFDSHAFLALFQISDGDRSGDVGVDQLLALPF